MTDRTNVWVLVTVLILQTAFYHVALIPRYEKIIGKYREVTNLYVEHADEWGNLIERCFAYIESEE